MNKQVTINVCKPFIMAIASVFFCHMLTGQQNESAGVVGNDVPLQFQAWGKTAPIAGEMIPSPEGWREVKEDFKSPDFSQELKKNGYIVFIKHYSEPVYSETIPSLEEIRKQTSIFGAPDEYRPVTFSIRALDTLENVRVTVSDFKGENGNAIPSSNVDVRVVNFINRPVNETLKTYKRVPSFIERRETVNIAAGTTRQFYLAIKIPAGTEASTYKATVTVKPENKTASEIDVFLNVLPIDLQEPDIGFGIILKRFPAHWEKMFGLYPGNWKKHVLDCKEHGLHSLDYYESPEIRKINGEITLNFDVRGENPCSVQEFMDFGIKSGFFKKSIPVVWFGAQGIARTAERISGKPRGTAEFEDCYRTIALKIKDYAEKNNWPEFIFNVADEPSNAPEAMKDCKSDINLVKTIPGIRSAAMLNGPWFGIYDFEILKPKVVLYNYITQKILDDIEKEKSELWIYNTGTDRFNYGFYLYRVKGKGIIPWIYQNPPAGYPSSGDNPYAVFSKNTYLTTYPSPTGPLPTIKWESVREGVADYKYVYTLTQFIEKAKASSNDAAKKETQTAEDLIASIMKDIPVDVKKTAAYRQTHTDQTFEYYRWQLAQEIIKLQNLLTPVSSTNNKAATVTAKGFEPPMPVALQNQLSVEKAEVLTKDSITGLLALAGYKAGQIFPADENTGIRKIIVNETKTPIKLDGSLKSPDWQKASKVTAFLLTKEYANNFIKGLSEKKNIAPVPPIKAKDQTEVYVSHDDSNLYIAVYCNQPSGQILAVQTKKDSPVWRDDSIELFIDPEHDAKGYFHIIINPNGASYDAWKRPDSTNTADTEWNGDYQVSTSKGKTYWIAEIAIPFAALGKKNPKDGTVMGFNVTRNNISGKESSSWAYLNNNFHEPASFGVLELRGFDSGAAPAVKK